MAPFHIFLENTFLKNEKNLLTQHSTVPGVDILQKMPKNAQGGINSAQAKFPESPKKVFLLPRNEEIMMFFALNCHF